MPVSYPLHNAVRVSNHIAVQRDLSRLLRKRPSMPQKTSTLDCSKSRVTQAYQKTLDQVSGPFSRGLKPGLLLNDRYRLEAQLGYDRPGAVWWLCQDVRNNTFESLKVSATRTKHDRQHRILDHIRAQGLEFSEGYENVKLPFQGSFDLLLEDSTFTCTPYPMTWASLWDLRVHDMWVLDEDVVKSAAYAILRALAYLHDAGVVHTNLTIHSYLCGPPVDRVTENFITSRRGQRPLDLNIGKYPTIYSVCETGPGKDLPFTRYLPITVLGDLHDAVFGRTEYTKRIQHPLYRAPEVARKQPWTSKADIWNVGALLWHLLLRYENAKGFDVELSFESVLDLLADPDSWAVVRSGRVDGWWFFQFMRSTGYKAKKAGSGHDRQHTVVEDSEESQEIDELVDFFASMLQKDPLQRKSARELCGHPWLRDHSQQERS